MNFGENLRKVRTLRRLSQLELANRSGLHQTIISHFETGKRSPSFENLVKLANALECASDELIGRGRDSALTDQEVHYMAQFRNLSLANRNIVLYLMRMMTTPF